MKNNFSEMIWIFQLFCQTILYRIIFYFFLESSKNFIPDDEHHSHISIKVTDIACMMNPVMGRTYKYCFKPVWHFINVLCMNQYSINLGQGIHKNNVEWFKTQQ